MNNQESPMLRMERHLGRVLIAGASVSAGALIAGLIGYLLAPQSATAARLLTAGLVLLMVTPMLRVMVSVAEYVRMRDWFFVATTVAVLIELAVTVLYALMR